MEICELSQNFMFHDLIYQDPMGSLRCQQRGLGQFYVHRRAYLALRSGTVGPWDALVQLLPGEIRLAGVKGLRHVVLPGTPLGPGLNCQISMWNTS